MFMINVDVGWLAAQMVWRGQTCNDIMFSYCSYSVDVTNWSYGGEVTTKPVGWFHLAFVFLGANYGLIVYYDGEEMFRVTNTLDKSNQPSSGRMFIGKSMYNYEDCYASVMMDELTVWDN